jgi:hypothetical protein
MQPSVAYRILTLAGAVALGLGLGSPGLQAQPAAVQTAQLATTTQQLQTPLSPGFTNGKAPALYEGELEDLGPQYVLVPKPAHKWFNVMFDWQTYYTNNAALSEIDRQSTDVNAMTVQLLAQAPVYKVGDLQVQPRLGFRYQAYWYGLLSGQNRLVGGAAAQGGTPVWNNDFMTYTPFLEALYQYGKFLGSTGVRYAAFTNSHVQTQPSTTTTFYQEFAPYWLLGYQITLGKSQMLLLQYDGDFRLSDTPQPTTLIPTNLNDRTDNALSVVYSYILGGKWAFQPTYRYQWSYYTNGSSNPTGGPHRSDQYDTLSLVIAYYFTDYCSARVFTSYEWRSSNVAGNNYQNLNAGAGVNLSYNF